MDFENIDYLKTGNERQKKVFEVLTQNNIMPLLQEFDPILVGTFPIHIDIATSDLDIICYWKNKPEFISKIKEHFSNKEKFTIREVTELDSEAVVANFEIDHFEIEIFGQNIPTKNQNGYRHMIIENEIIKLKGEDFRLQIIELKKKGLKTEPAFGQLLGLGDNPYQELLDYKIS